MEKQHRLNAYTGWLTHREYSPATIQKYTKALARFFADTGAGETPRPRDRRRLAGQPDGQGLHPLHRQRLLAAVNDYQESIDNPAGKAKPLKRQRRIFADPGPGTLPRRVFPPAERRPRHRQQAQPTAARDHLLHRHPRFGTAVHHGGGRPPPQSQHPLQGQMPRDPVAGRALPPADPLVPEASHPHRPGFSLPQGKPLCRVTVWKLLKALCERANVAWKKVFPHNLRHLFARTFYDLEKNISKLADLLGHSSIETTRIYIMESGAEHERLSE